ncbi:apolipoprotein N-acyltransferase [Dactylosporangium maewongense]|uniref:Apolipoprotein N-acyltransferase n=1 Tax=Dactylosporangium maewongense TaxID=634393 RepID=A0ABN2AY51_9ACTN
MTLVSTSSAADGSDEAPAARVPADPDPARTARPLPLWAAVLLAAVAGPVMLVAFPPYGWWWAAPVAVALAAVSVHGRRLRAGFGLGTLTGALFFTPLLEWTNLHTGMVPWLLLSTLQALFIGLLGAATAWVSGLRARPWVWAGAVAALWTAQEALRDRAPFGGFPWGRLAFSQDTSPLLRLAAVGGAPLVTFAVAVTGALLAVPFVKTVSTSRTAGEDTVTRGWFERVKPAAGPVAAVVVVAGALLVPVHRATGAGVYVAVVQGNVPRLGLDFNEQRRAVLDNHVRATVELGREVTEGGARRPDLVVWPENSSDIDPLRNADAAAAIATAARAVGVPILVGAVLTDPAVGVENAGLVWEPDVDAAGNPRQGGVSARYTKRHPVPFAETMPLRDIARMVSKEVDRVSDMTPGDTPGVLRVGPAVVGDVICFEVAYDGLVRDTVTGGAQLLAVQTNNATFDEAEARQQLAMVRLRAVEHGRDALMASTVGISAFADPSGGTSDETRFNEGAVILRELHLGSGRTVATTVGAGPEYVIVMLGIGALVAAAAVRRRTRQHPAAPTEEDA